MGTMMNRVLAVLLIAKGHAFTLPALAPARVQPASCAMMEGEDLTQKGSSLTLTDEQRAERSEKKALINKLIPGLAIAAFAINAATGGALGKVEVGLPGPGPPGMAEARALKQKSVEKSKANYEKLKTGVEAPRS